MKRISLLLPLAGIMVMMTMTSPAIVARDSQGDGTASTPAPPPSNSPESKPSPELPPPAPTPPPEANPPSSPGPAVPSVPTAPPAEERTITGILAGSPSNSLVIRNDAGVEVTLHVESSSLLPESMLLGERVTVVYRELPGGLREAVKVTPAPAGKKAASKIAPSASSAPVRIARGGGPSRTTAAENRSTSSRLSGSASPKSAPSAVQPSGASGPGGEEKKHETAPVESRTTGSGPTASVPDAPGTIAGGTPGSETTKGTTTEGRPAESAASGSAAAEGGTTSTKPDGSVWTTRARLLPVIFVGGILILGLVFGLWSYARNR